MCFYFLHAPTSLASYKVTPPLKEAYQQIFKLQTPLARANLKKALKTDPKNGFAHYLQNYADVVDCIITGERYRYEILLEEYDKRINIIEGLDESSPYHKFILSEMKLQLAFTKLYFKDRISSFWSLKSAYKLCKDNLEDHPGFKPSRKTAGILEILIGSVPQDQQWIASISGFKGSKDRGLKMLKNVIEKDSIFKDEAQILYWLTEFHLNKKDPINQLKKVNEYYQGNRDNLLIAFIYSTMLTKLGRNDASLDVLNRLPTGSDYVSFEYLNSMRADCHLYKGEHNHAIINYQDFLKHYKGEHYIKSAYFKLSLAYWLQDKYELSDKYRLKAINEGTSYFDTDKKAFKYANQNITLHKTLLQAQLFHDGGYYEETLSLLNSIDAEQFKLHEHKVEYFYRKGRTYQKIGFYDKAIRHFISTINMAKSSNNHLYYAPNACLQLGHLFKEKKEYEKASTYYKKASDYHGHEYESSINTEAKRALKALSIQ